jgi:hypothetical protein
METIKAGIKLEITSWENDADNYNTKSITGLTEDEAKFYIEFAKLFKSCNQQGEKEHFGNTSDLTKDQELALNKLVCDLVKKYPLASNVYNGYGYNEHEIDNGDFIHNLSSDILGCCEYITFRVYDSYRAYVIPMEITEIDLGFKD